MSFNNARLQKKSKIFAADNRRMSGFVGGGGGCVGGGGGTPRDETPRSMHAGFHFPASENAKPLQEVKYNSSTLLPPPEKKKTLAHTHLDILLWQVILPYIPEFSRVESFVSFLAMHSLIFTCTTPIYRMLCNHWIGSSVIYVMLQFTLPHTFFGYLESRGIVDPGITYIEEGGIPITESDTDPVIGIDKAFALHISMSIIWLIVSYAQAVHTLRLNFHRHFGYFAIISFACHVLGSWFSLYTDVVRHKQLPRLILLMSSTNSIINMWRAIRAVQNPHKDVKMHTTLIMFCWLESIQGAGSIRTVEHINTLLGTGPFACQKNHSSMATLCMWPYVFRMMNVNALTLFYKLIYCKISRDVGVIRYVFYEIRWFIFAYLALFIFSYSSYTDTALDMVLGSERTTRGTLTIFSVAILRLYIGLRT